MRLAILEATDAPPGLAVRVPATNNNQPVRLPVKSMQSLAGRSMRAASRIGPPARPLS